MNEYLLLLKTFWTMFVDNTFRVKKSLHFGLMLHFASIVTFCGVTDLADVRGMVK